MQDFPPQGRIYLMILKGGAAMAVWKCSSCGAVMEGRCKPGKCPHCGAPREALVKEESKEK